MPMTLKAARVNKNLIRKDAAAQLGISDRTLYSWETGKSFPDAKQISDIENLYGVPYNEIIFLPKDVGLNDKKGE